MLPWEWSCLGGSVSAAAPWPTLQTRGPRRHSITHEHTARGRLRVLAKLRPWPLLLSALHCEVTWHMQKCCDRRMPCTQTRTCVHTQARRTELHERVHVPTRRCDLNSTWSPGDMLQQVLNCHQEFPQTPRREALASPGRGPWGPFVAAQTLWERPSFWVSLKAQWVPGSAQRGLLRPSS